MTKMCFELILRVTTGDPNELGRCTLEERQLLRLDLKPDAVEAERVAEAVTEMLAKACGTPLVRAYTAGEEDT